MLKKGDKVMCMDAKEVGIPVEEGSVYTIKSYNANADKEWGDGSITDNGPGVTLEEVSGYYRASRFRNS